MQPEDLIRLRHMLEAAQKVVEFTKGKSEVNFSKDEQLALAVVRLLEIVGEAAKNVSNEVRNSHPEIPWKEIAGTRDRLIHGYFDVDLDIIGRIVTKDLPDLIIHLETIIKQK